jgi:LacI family transcriptional regulator
MSAVTIIDVAKRAGVSFKTVSRVLNREKNVHVHTRDRVLAAAAELGYRPNIGARSLAGARSYLIGLFIDNPSFAYIGTVQLGAMSRCRHDGYHLLLETLDIGAADAEADLAGLLSAVRLDGLILTAPICNDSAVLEALEARAVPYVRVSPDRDRDRAPWVGMDDAGAAREMTRRLLELGHRDIGFVEGPAGHGASALRRQGFLAALAEAGVTPRPDLIRAGRFDFRSGLEAADFMLDQARPPTAIFASNDEMALGVTMAAHRRGLNVPADLSIAGFDDIPAATMVWPRLTTVRQPIFEMAAAAADMIISGQAKTRDAAWPPRRLLDFEVVIRDSTAPPKR